MRSLPAATLLVAVLVLAGCTDDTEVTEPVDTTASPSGSETASVDGTGDDGADSAGGDGTLAAAYGVASVVLTTPTSGEGPRPVLAWEPVEGAETYVVALMDPEGDPYWGWEAPETSVPVGGSPRLGDAEPGPRVIDGMTWMVSAHDADGHVIGVSDPRPIAP